MNVGDIFRVHTSLANPPKIKIALFVGNGMFLWFNTEPRRRPAQMLVFSNEVPGITRDCHLDCGQIHAVPESGVGYSRLLRAGPCGLSFKGVARGSAAGRDDAERPTQLGSGCAQTGLVRATRNSGPEFGGRRRPEPQGRKSSCTHRSGAWCGRPGRARAPGNNF